MGDQGRQSDDLALSERWGESCRSASATADPALVLEMHLIVSIKMHGTTGGLIAWIWMPVTSAFLHVVCRSCKGIFVLFVPDKQTRSKLRMQQKFIEVHSLLRSRSTARY